MSDYTEHLISMAGGDGRSGLQAWHRAPCAWCDSPSKGDASFYGGLGLWTYYASCGAHGDDFKYFPAQAQP